MPVQQWESVFTDGGVVWIYDRQMQRNQTVSPMDSLQVDGFDVRAGESRIQPCERKLGSVNCVVKVKVLVGVDGDVKRCVIRTSCFVDDRESIGDNGIVG